MDNTVNYYPDGSGGYSAIGANTAVIVTPNISASASTAYPVTNLCGRTMVAYFSINTLPGSGSTTLALKVQAINPASANSFVTLLAGAARSASGTTVMMIGPGISTSALGVPAILPRDLRFLVSQSSGATSKDVTFSIGVHFGV